MNIFSLFDLSGKTAIVTGGGAGLGRMMAIGLAEAGANIVVCSRKLENCEDTAHEIEKLGVKALALKCEITSQGDIEQVTKSTIKEFQKVDILVNNSGRTWGATPEEFKIDDWKRVIDVNINGTFIMSQRVGREMIKQKSGKIVNISSYAGLGGTDPEHLNAIAYNTCLLYTSPSPRDLSTSRMPSSA